MSRYKGFVLAMMVDILSGVVTGAASGPEVGDLFSSETSEKENVGHYFQAIHIDHLVPIQEFEQRIDRLIRQLRSAPRMPGVDKFTCLETAVARQNKNAGNRVSLSALTSRMSWGGSEKNMV